MTCNLNCLIETEGLFKVAGSHIHIHGNAGVACMLRGDNNKRRLGKNK